MYMYINIYVYIYIYIYTYIYVGKRCTEPVLPPPVFLQDIVPGPSTSAKTSSAKNVRTNSGDGSAMLGEAGFMCFMWDV
jgi:hypothetical protein